MKSEKYNNDLRKIKILSKDEWKENWYKWKKTGDEKYRTKLLESVLRLNYQTVLKFQRAIVRYRHIDFEDLISEANLASINALEKWSPDMGYGFVGLNIRYVETAIKRFLTAHANQGIHLPRITKLEVERMEKGGGEVADFHRIDRKWDLANAYRAHTCNCFSESDPKKLFSLSCGSRHPEARLEREENKREIREECEFIKENASDEAMELIENRLGLEFIEDRLELVEPLTWRELSEKFKFSGQTLRIRYNQEMARLSGLLKLRRRIKQ